MNKISKKTVIIVCIIIIALGSLLSFNIINNKNKKESQEVETQVDPKTREKSDNSLLEDIIRNFRSIYVSLVNDKELDFSFLNNVITKDSEIYKKVVEDITSKRSMNIKLEDQNVDINEIKEITNGYEVFTQITYIETVNGVAKNISLEQKFNISVQDNNITIKEIE